MTRADFAIVGAGIIGTMAAREIARRDPQARTVLLDRDMTGSGATRRSAGLHFPRGATERSRAMTEYSQTYYQQLKQERPGLPIHALSMDVVAAQANEAAVTQVYLEQAKLLRVDSVAHPAVRVPENAAVWTGQGCQYADVYALTQELAAELRPRTEFREAVRVTAVEPGDGGVTLRLGTGETLRARQAVLAPGPWLADPAWRSLVAPLGARVKKVVALHVAQVPQPHDGAIVFQDEDAFLLPLHHRGHWLFSYTCREWDVDPDELAGGLSAANLAEALEILNRYAPGMAEHCTAGRVFCDAFSGTGEPLVRALDDAGSVIFAGAANGSGYRLAPAIAAQTADLLHFAPSTGSQL